MGGYTLITNKMDAKKVVKKSHLASKLGRS